MEMCTRHSSAHLKSQHSGMQSQEDCKFDPSEIPVLGLIKEKKKFRGWYQPLPSNAVLLWESSHLKTLGHNQKTPQDFVSYRQMCFRT